MKTVPLVVALFALKLGIPVSASAAPPEPSGYGKARFGMTVEQVKQIYPAMTDPTIVSPQSQLASGPDPLPLARYQINKQELSTLSGCDVVFQFYREALMQTEFYCPDKTAVAPYLEREFGPPSSRTARAWFWFGDTTVIAYNPHSGIFSFADKEANQSLQLTLLGRIMAAQQPQDQPNSENSEASGSEPKP